MKVFEKGRSEDGNREAPAWMQQLFINIFIDDKQV